MMYTKMNVTCTKKRDDCQDEWQVVQLRGGVDLEIHTQTTYSDAAAHQHNLMINLHSYTFCRCQSQDGGA